MPNATLKLLLAELALPKPDRAQVAYLLVNLSEWIVKGGELPDVTNGSVRAIFEVAA